MMEARLLMVALLLLAPSETRSLRVQSYHRLSPRSPSPLALARGFGTPKSPPSPPVLDADAAALLEEAGGDVEKARTNYIGYTLAYLKDADPDLYSSIKEDPAAARSHQALVELTWDAIAAASVPLPRPRPRP